MPCLGFGANPNVQPGAYARRSGYSMLVLPLHLYFVPNTAIAVGPITCVNWWVQA